MAVIRCNECKGAVSTSAKSCPHCGASAKKFMPRTEIMRTIPYIFGALVLVVLFSPKKDQETQVTAAASGQRPAVARSEASISPEGLCRAGVATVMGRPIASITATKGVSPVELSYVREIDGSKWEYRCKVDGDRIIWAAKIDGAWGRWRIHPDDSVVSYRRLGESVVIDEKYGASVSASKTFLVSDL